MRSPSASPSSSLRSLDLRCPPLSRTFTDALALLEDAGHLEAKQVITLVQRDPVVVAQLLKTANSAYYGMRRSVDNVERAVIALGPVAVAGLVVSMNMLKLQKTMGGPAGDCFARLIRHSVATAFLTQHLLARSSAATVSGVGFTAGLLHDFGKIILVHNFPEKALALYDEDTVAEQTSDTDACHVEQLLFGCDHTEAGTFAACALRFPDALIRVIRRHHIFETSAEGTRSSSNQADERGAAADPACPLLHVAAANSVAKAMGYAFAEPRTWAACAAAPVWTRLRPEAPAREALLHDLRAQQEHLDAYVRRVAPPLRSEGKK